MEKIYLVKQDYAVLAAFKSYESAESCIFDLTKYWHSKFKNLCPNYKILPIWLDD